MKERYLILVPMILIQCSTKVDSLDGHYISAAEALPGRYETLEVVDSLVLADGSLWEDITGDTIVIDPATRKFLKVTRKSMSPIFDFSVVSDTLEVHFEHDLGQDKIKFIKVTQ